jgi:hypothetical protein
MIETNCTLLIITFYLKTIKNILVNLIILQFNGNEKVLFQYLETLYYEY